MKPGLPEVGSPGQREDVGILIAFILMEQSEWTH
jgi:hypothetical protein